MPEVEIKNCYDFPLAVLHRTSGDCPRYSGGTCHPLPTPTPPYSLEEAAAVASYEALVSGELGADPSTNLSLVRARGESEVDGKVVESGDPIVGAILIAGAHADQVRRKDDA